MTLQQLRYADAFMEVVKTNASIRRTGIQPSRAADAFMAEMHKLISNS